MSSKLRVLIVEDEPVSRELLADFLRMAGYDVAAPATGEQALLTLMRERGRFDCLFTNIELAGLVDGWMLADEFRFADPRRPVVFAAKNAAGTRAPERAVVLSRPALPPTVVEAVNAVTARAAGKRRSHAAPPRAAEAAAKAPAKARQAGRARVLRRAAG
jgi:CheY-like chemotaxis protein